MLTKSKKQAPKSISVANFMLNQFEFGTTDINIKVKLYTMFEIA